jgi:hypothetical protein
MAFNYIKVFDRIGLCFSLSKEANKLEGRQSLTRRERQRGRSQSLITGVQKRETTHVSLLDCSEVKMISITCKWNGKDEEKQPAEENGSNNNGTPDVKTCIAHHQVSYYDRQQACTIRNGTLNKMKRDECRECTFKPSTSHRFEMELSIIRRL